MLRTVLAVVLGLVMGGMVVFAIEVVGHLIHPPPADLDTGDREAMKRYVEQLPPAAFLFVLLAYAAGSFAGGWVAARVARRAPLVHAVIVGALLLAAGIMNVVMIPHPLWFTFASLAVFLPAALAGAWLARRPVLPQSV